MTGTELKKRVDSMRQTLVGAVPSPAGQIDQITYALIYKFMNDIDDKAAGLGGKRTYFTGDYEKYNWHTLMSPTLGAHERLALYREALEKLSKNSNLPELFQNIYQNAFLPFNDARILTMLLKEIDYFEHGYGDDIGDVYEYLLSITGAQGDVGQFRTPRHIIDFIIEAVAPTKDDSVLDPACGTAGFLISAYNHVRRHHDGKNDITGEADDSEKHLTADEKNKLFHNYRGFDIDPTMVRTARVNMYLHGFSTPDIKNHDTLSSDEYWNEKYDVILANPPFMSPKGGIKPHKKFSIEANRAEVLFVDYIASHLKPTGRAGVIVPEGIIFQGGKAYKELRKNLVENYLYAVVSLPAGVFNPYSGVKTSILLLDKEIAKAKKEILFVRVEQDGFDLGAQRRPIAKNDLLTALNIIDKWKAGETVKDNLAVCVEKSKIVENGDYNLSGDRYRVATDYTNTKWPIVELGEVIHLDFGERITKNNKQGTKYPVYGGGGESFRTDEFNRENEYVIARFAMSEHCIRFVAGQFWMMDSGGTFSIKPEYQDRLNKNFVGKILLSRQEDIFMCARGGAQKNLNNDHFYELKIPLPPIEIQEQIVSELDGYAGIIAGAKQIAQNWKPKIDIDSEWEKVKLGEVCDVKGGKRVPKGKTLSSDPTEYPYIRVVDFLDGTVSLQNLRFISKEIFEEIKRYTISVDDVYISIAGTIGLVGTIPPELNNKSLTENAAKLVIKDRSRLSNIYLAKLLQSIDSQEQIKKLTQGVGVPKLGLERISTIKIPLPALAIQKQIVEKIEAERILVESTKKLIEIYEQKTKEVVSKLWKM